MRVVIEYEAGTGRILRWHQPAAPTLNEDAAELEVTVDAPDDLVGMRVDVSGETPKLVPDPEAEILPSDSLQKWAERLEARQPVARRQVSEDSMTAFRDARSNDDVQTQLDILFEILTGEEP